MPTPEHPDWNRAEREQIAWEEEQWARRLARRERHPGGLGRKVMALFLVLLLVWIYVIRYLI